MTQHTTGRPARAAWFLAAALFLLAGAGAPAADEAGRLAALLKEARQLESALPTAREREKIGSLYTEGVKLLMNAPRIPRESKLRFLLAAADWAQSARAYRDVLKRLEGAVAIADAEDVPRLEARIKDLRHFLPLWDSLRAPRSRVSEADALRTAARIIKECPDFATEAMGWQTRIHVEAGRLNEAADVRRRVLQAAKTPAEKERAFLGIAGTYYSQGQAAKALAAYQQCLKDFGDREERVLVHRAIALCYVDLKRGAEALKEVQAAREVLAQADAGLRAHYEPRFRDVEAKARALKP